MSVAFVSCAPLTPPAWLSVQRCPFNNGLAVFSFYLPDHLANLHLLGKLLQPDELARAQRYHQVADQNRFIAGRGLLRLLSGLYTNQPPDKVTIGLSQHQKPILAGISGWHINLSHAGNWVVFAIGRVAMGIDVEELNPGFRYEEILSSIFSAAEQKQIRTASQPLRQFFDGWTRKEALLKATGQGLHDDLQAVPCLDGEYQIPDSRIGSAGSWIVRGFALSDTYQAAVAYETCADEPQFYTIDAGFIAQDGLRNS